MRNTQMNRHLCRLYTRAYISTMTIASRLDYAMKAAGIESQSALARMSGVPQPTINRILKGVGKKGPEAHTIVPLAEACNVSFQWLYEGLGPMERQAATPPGAPARVMQVEIGDEHSGKFVGIRMLKRYIYAGVDGVDGDWEYEGEVSLTLSADWVREKGLHPEDLFAFEASGMSMYPGIKPGNILVGNRRDKEPVDGKLFAINHNGRPVVKRLERDSGIWYLASDNPLPEYGRRPVDNDTRIIGRIVRMEVDLI